MSALVNRIRKSAETREGQAKLPLTDGKIEKIFDSLGAQKAVPQLQRFMVEKILNDLKKGDVDDFAVRLDLFDEAKLVIFVRLLETLSKSLAFLTGLRPVTLRRDLQEEAMQVSS